MSRGQGLGARRTPPESASVGYSLVATISEELGKLTRQDLRARYDPSKMEGVYPAWEYSSSKSGLTVSQIDERFKAHYEVFVGLREFVQRVASDRAPMLYHIAC
jgi:hypothetical protein